MLRCHSILMGGSHIVDHGPCGPCVWGARAPVQISPFAPRIFVRIDRKK